MHELISNIAIKVNDKVYLKDPLTSELGRRIVQGSVDLIDEIGFEAFTFGKLAKRIGSTEASVYRYFESKHKLLLYLVSWYWTWMEYKLVFSVSNLQSEWDKLERAIQVLTEPVDKESANNQIDIVKLNRIIISEASKVYLTRDVDEENSFGAFAGYKRLVGRVSDIILEIRPDYNYPHMLISTVIEGAHHQRFFAQHLPRLTDVVDGEDAIVSFYKQMVRKALA